MGSVVTACGPSCFAACEILLDQGLNPCPLHWQASSQLLDCQRSPTSSVSFLFCLKISITLLMLPIGCCRLSICSASSILITTVLNSSSGKKDGSFGMEGYYGAVYECPLVGCICQKKSPDCGLQVSHLHSLAMYQNTPSLLIKRLVFTDLWVGFSFLQKKNLIHDNRKTMLFIE